jgi:hypothetical protein
MPLMLHVVCYWCVPTAGCIPGYAGHGTSCAMVEYSVHYKVHSQAGPYRDCAFMYHFMLSTLSLTAMCVHHLLQDP